MRNGIISVFVLLLLVGCGMDCPVESVPGGNTPPEETPSASPFDYSMMGEHPRLLLREGDFAAMQAAIESDARLSQVHDIILAGAEEHLTKPSLTYKKTGRRLLSVSRSAIERILYLSYSYRMTGDVRYLKKAEATICEVSAFADWNQSEHYLDVGEMAFGVAIGLDWLYYDLKPETRAKAVSALKAFAFDTYLTDDGDIFRGSVSNWNQVCAGGLIAAAIACYETDPAAMSKVIDTLVENNRTHGMTIYNTDGNYSEGYTYWAYGTTYQVIALAALENVFGHDGGLKASSAGFSKTGQWIIFMEGPSGQCFNFSDSNAPVYPRLPLWYLSSYYRNADLLYKEVKKIDDGSYGEPFDEDRFLPLVQVFADASLLKRNMYPPIQKVWVGGETVETHPNVLVHTDMEHPENDYFLAIKGGRASTSHAHMDGGSFVFDAFGMRWAMDLGLQKYNGLETYGIDLWNFGKNSTRWNVFRLNNFSHNVISVNGNIYHNEGGAFLDKNFNKGRPGALGGKFTCYALNRYVQPDNDLVNPLTRIAELVPNGSAYDLVITDDFKAAPGKTHEISWSMATPAAAQILSDNCISLTQNGRTMYLTCTEASGAALKAFVKDANTGQEWDEQNDGVTLVGFEGKMNEGQAWKLTTIISTVASKV